MGLRKTFLQALEQPLLLFSHISPFSPLTLHVTTIILHLGLKFKHLTDLVHLRTFD